MPSNKDSNTLVATGSGTRDTLATITDAGNYNLKVNTENMVLGDHIFLEIFDKPLTGSTSRRVYPAHYFNVQSNNIKISIPITTVFETVFFLTLESSTSRNFEWAVVDMA